MGSGRFVVGADFGSNSVRVLIIEARTGAEMGVATVGYARGDKGVLTDPKNPHVARQSPTDYLESLRKATTKALAHAKKVKGFSPAAVIGIGVDTTGSSPIPVTATMTPLAELPEFKENLNAQAWMWKDHSAMEEAEKITALAAKIRPHYLAKCGGTYSSEWFFSKLWHCLNTDRKVFEKAHSWVEFADFIPAVLAGIKKPELITRGVCAAGHKAMYHAQWGGLPDAEFLGKLDKRLAALLPRLFTKAHASDETAGHLCDEWAEKLALPKGIPIAVGAFDAHLGAVGAGVGDGRLVKIIGTSACDIMAAPAATRLPDIPGVCGIVNGSVIPGCYGIEAGQSAVGDIFSWFVEKVCQGGDKKFAELTTEAERLAVGQSGLLALDWHNGNRTILTDARLTGLIVGLTLHSSQAEIFRALIEGTAFGARKIIDRLEEYTVHISEVVACGGIAEKNPLFMQIYADVLNRPMRISASAQTCALGAAICGAVVAGKKAGGYATVEEAQKKLCRFKPLVYKPKPKNVAAYATLYTLYTELHDSFGVKGVRVDHHGLMKILLELSRKARK